MSLQRPIFADRPDVVAAFLGAEPRGQAAWDQHARQLGLPGAPVARAIQVHGAHAVEVLGGGDAGEADALTSRQPGLLVAVVTADCVPVLVVGQGVVAAIHAGWRGLVAGVISQTLARMAQDGPLSAAIGPCISAPNYEVGDEVIAEFVAAGVPEAVVARRDPAWPRVHADVRAVAAHQLRAAGCGSVWLSDRCTFADSALASYRRDGPHSGRQVSIIGLRP